MNSTKESTSEDTRRVEYVRYKRPTLDEGRISFSWVELTNDENVTSMFWEHNMFQWIDMQVTLLRSEGEKNHKKGRGLNCVFKNFFLYVLKNCSQIQSLK